MSKLHWHRVFVIGVLIYAYSMAAVGQPLAGEGTSAEEEAAFADEESGESQLLPPMTISAPRYKPTLNPVEQYMLDMAFRFGALTFRLDYSTVIAPERVVQGVKNSVYSVEIFDPVASRARGSVLAALRSSIALGNARGFDGVAGAATLAGMQPRVSVDRLVANHPFDGSINWDELPDAGLARAEFVPGGGSSAWSEAPAGIVQLVTLPALPRIVRDSSSLSTTDPQYAQPPRQTVHRTGLLSAELGSFDTRRLELVHTEPTKAGMFQFMGRISAGNGFIATFDDRRGVVDQPRGNRHHEMSMRWRRLIGDRAEMIATARTAEVTQGLGTLYQREHDRTGVVSVELSGRTNEGFVWSAIGSVEHRGRSRTFSIVEQTRGFETPAIDEFAEPVTTYVASLSGMWHGWNDSRTNVGMDLRRTAGETRNRHAFSEGAFTRETIAGGEHWVAGVYALHNRRLTKDVRGMAGMRIDFWQQGDGFVRNTDLMANRRTHAERSSDERGVEFGPSAGLVWKPRKHWRVRVAGQESFRTPTLAERYRPDGDMNRVIAPNSKLKTERSHGAEITLEYDPGKALGMKARIFANEISDPIGTRLTGVNSVEPMIIAPAYSTVEYRSRVNFERLRVRGVELSLRYAASEAWSIEAGARLQDNTLVGMAGSPSDLHHQAPGMPRQAAFTGVNWRLTSRFSLRGGAQWHGRVFANEENTIRLGEAVVLNGAASFRLNAAAEIFFRLENMKDDSVEIARGADGTRYRTRPRTFFGGVRVAW